MPEEDPLAEEDPEEEADLTAADERDTNTHQEIVNFFGRLTISAGLNHEKCNENGWHHKVFLVSPSKQKTPKNMKPETNVSHQTTAYCTILSEPRATHWFGTVWSWINEEPPIVDHWVTFLDDQNHNDSNDDKVNLTELAASHTPYCHLERITSLCFPYIIKLDRYILFQDSNLDSSNLFSPEFLAQHPQWTAHDLYSNLQCVYHRAAVGVSSAKSDKALFLTEVCDNNHMLQVVGYSTTVFPRRQELLHVLRKILVRQQK